MLDQHYRRLVLLMMLATLLLTAWGITRPAVIIEQSATQPPAIFGPSTGSQMLDETVDAD